MLDPMIGVVPTFNPELYYNRQLRGNTHYSIYQSGRGLGSRLFNIIISVGAVLPTGFSVIPSYGGGGSFLAP